jgi:hypothetical protein
MTYPRDPATRKKGQPGPTPGQAKPRRQAGRRDAILLELGRQMSVISEAAAYSRWAYQVEDELPPLLCKASRSGRPAYYQGVDMSPVYADWPVSLAEELGHRVTQDGGGNVVPHVPRHRRTRRNSPSRPGSKRGAQP